MILLAVLLLVNAVFNVLVWPTYRRIAKDERAHDANGRATRFLRVHAVLIGTALLLALVSAIVGVLALAGALG